MGSEAPAAGLTWPLIEEARARIAPHIHRTPILTSATLDAEAGARLYFKCENFQKGGAFKTRGATNAVLSLPEAELRRGVATHSSGNHAAALARAARLRGVPAYIVMPENTAAAKRAAVERYGATITWCEPTQAARERAAERVVAETGATLVHPYNDLRVMAGQASVGLELIEQVRDLDLLLCPVSGGGLLSGIAVAVRRLAPAVRIVGVEPQGADDAARSLRAGRIVAVEHPATIADGLRATIGALPFAEIRRCVDDIVTVPDAAIVSAMRRLFEVMKIVVEPSGAAAYAAVTAARVKLDGARVGVVVSGGNLDLDSLPWIRPAPG
ncbi:MAG TPA: pyridoxal-phosphate dependent enzyme [Steroidobacteraceae bacterium]|nr:pyridoxal-phosphate dependent enzyme [Steroidobacteraceae bacterium]